MLGSNHPTQKGSTVELDEVIPAIWRPLNRRMLAGILGREPTDEELDAWLAERASYCPECGRPFEEE